MFSNCKKLWIWYLAVFGCLMLIYNSVNAPVPSADWDDYSLPIASILNDQNFSISDADVVAYKQLFPQWAASVESSSLSGFTVKGGNGELPLFFPIYALLCVPFTLLLKLLGLPTIYTFPFANLTVLLISLMVLYRCLNCSEKVRFLLMILLSVNPIVFYIGAASSEVFVYALLVLGLTFWYNRWYKQAALLVSLAGMIHPIILSFGLVMIPEYVIELLKSKAQSTSWRIYAREALPKLLRYLALYVIGFVPMLYYSYHTEHTNLILVHNELSQNETIWARFASNLFDLNYGILPYFTVILGLAAVLLILACLRKHIRYFLWLGMFALSIFLSSMVIQNNADMAGIAQYNTWGILPLIFAVVLFGQELLKGKHASGVVRSLLCVGTVLTGIIVFMYGPHLASNTAYAEFTPIAGWVMNKAPQLYNPLHSTFSSRVNYHDTEEPVNTPVVYIGEDGYVRKILATSKDKAQLQDKYQSYAAEENATWFAEQLNRLEDTPGYISVPAEYRVAPNIAEYTLGDSINFTSSEFNATEYVLRGLYPAEDWGSWTKETHLTLRMKPTTSAEVLHADISCSVYNQKQAVTIYVNDRRVYHNPSYNGDGIQFDFTLLPTDEFVELRFEIPQTVATVGLRPADRRLLGLGLSKVVLSETSRVPEYTMGEPIIFKSEGNNATQYVLYGLHYSEDWGTWTDGTRFAFKLQAASDADKLHMDIACDVFNHQQAVTIYANDCQIYHNPSYFGEGIRFDFDNPKTYDGFIEFLFEIPEAISPSAFGSPDTRVVGLGFKDIIISEAS